MKHFLNYCFTICLITSCYRNGEYCEAFNTSRLPFDSLYYENQLEYTNGVDTITLYSDGNYTQASRLNPMANPICNPNFEMYYSAKTGQGFSFLYSFSYYPESDTTYLYIGVNNGKVSFDLDSTIKRRIEQNEERIFADFPQRLGVDSSYAIKSFVLHGMRIIEVEKLNGDKWKLIKVGNVSKK